ncbi:MAG: hypothetical protein QW738_05445, partial [Nitrososphaeria archaeon]
MKDIFISIRGRLLLNV